jgi:hypothetical protein
LSLLSLLSLFPSTSFAPEGLPLCGNWSPEAQLKLNSSNNLMIPLEEAEAFFLSHAAVFLDAQSQDLFADLTSNLPP